MSFELTQQQKEILKKFSDWKDMKINALAGTWKTTLLRLIVEQHPEKKFLVLVFNASVRKELKEKFPKNASIFTVHWFAFYNIKRRLNIKNMGIISPNQLLTKVMKKFNVSYISAKFLISVLKKYCDSDVITINSKTIWNLIKEDEILYAYLCKHKKSITFWNTAKYIKLVFASMIWWDISFTHDCYLKYFHLLINQFKNEFNYETVMLDEGQDTNPVSLDIFNKLNGQKIIVWDTHQGIYGWRWAINAMESVDYNDFYITKSFRINDKNASQWDFILKNYKSETNTLEAYFPNWCEWNGLTCHIFRTNASMIAFLFDRIKWWRLISFKFVRDIDEIFSTALAVEKVKYYYNSWDDSILKGIPDNILFIIDMCEKWNDFVDFVENLDDRELIASISLLIFLEKRYLGLDEQERKELIEDKTGKTFWLIEYIYNKSKKLLNENSSTVLSTAHTVKWLEFENVYIERWFPDIYSDLCKNFLNNPSWTKSVWFDRCAQESVDSLESLFYDKKRNLLNSTMRSSIEEINLMYVAITRAIKSLKIDSWAVTSLLEIPKKEFKNTVSQIWTSYDYGQMRRCSKYMLSKKGDTKFILWWVEYDIKSYKIADYIEVKKWEKSRKYKPRTGKFIIFEYKSKHIIDDYEIPNFFLKIWEDLYSYRPKLSTFDDKWINTICFNIHMEEKSWTFIIKNDESNFWVTIDLKSIPSTKKYLNN